MTPWHDARPAGLIKFRIARMNSFIMHGEVIEMVRKVNLNKRYVPHEWLRLAIRWVQI